MTQVSGWDAGPGLGSSACDTPMADQRPCAQDIQFPLALTWRWVELAGGKGKGGGGQNGRSGRSRKEPLIGISLASVIPPDLTCIWNV